MTKEEFIYLIVLLFLFNTVEPIVDLIYQLGLHDEIDWYKFIRTPFTDFKEVFYPLIGYFIDQKLNIKKLRANRVGILILAMITGWCIAASCTYRQYLAGEITKDFYECFDYLGAICTFIFFKYIMVKKGWLCQEWFGKLVRFVGPLTFGIYLIDPILRVNCYSTFRKVLDPYFGTLEQSCIWIAGSMIICGAITWLLRLFKPVRKLI